MKIGVQIVGKRWDESRIGQKKRRTESQSFLGL